MKNFIKLLSTLVVLFVNLSCNPAYAKDRLFNVHLVVVEGQESQIELFKEALLRLSEVKVKPRYLSIEIVPDMVQQNSLDDVYSRLYAWAKLYKNRRGHTYFILPPMQQGSRFFTAGQAGAICTTTRAKSKRFGEVSLHRNPAVAKTAAFHEVLHNLGANHIYRKTVIISKDPYKAEFQDIKNVMHPDAQRLADLYGDLPVAPLTKRHLRYCQEGLGVLGK